MSLDLRTVDLIERDLEKARKDTLELIGKIPENFLVNSPASFMGPIIWDLTHVAKFEELWILRKAGGRDNGEKYLDADYNAIRTPREKRLSLNLPSISESLAYLERVRNEVSEFLRKTNLNSTDRLLKNGFVFDMALQHECQHQETILQSLALYESLPFESPQLPPENGTMSEYGMVIFPAGEFIMGSRSKRFVYDNELPAHPVFVDEFYIDAAPVTDGRFMKFIREDGYDRKDLWSDEGWEWKTEQKVFAPLYWDKIEGEWHRRAYDKIITIRSDEPVVHVSYWEAEAFAKVEGKRLPTEAEWEKACRWDPDTGQTLTYPWGEELPDSDKANIDKRRWAPAPVGSYDKFSSPAGCHQMLGDVYEWTSSNFLPYDGFEAFPYDEYSEVHFGEKYKVLRGASWATSRHVTRSTFRNWDYPQRRQIFAGFRCAMEAD